MRKLVAWVDKRLFVTILAWLVLVTIIFQGLAFMWGLGMLSSMRVEPSLNLELVQVIFTVIGGIGAVAYLVIKYRERREAEERANEVHLRMGIEQLGSGSPITRIAGVYSLVDLADSGSGEYSQRVVNILCGYLRTDRLSDELRNRLISAKTSGAQHVDMTHVLNCDEPVETAILDAIKIRLSIGADELRNNKSRMGVAPKSWSHCNFNLRKSVISSPVELDGIWAEGRIDFGGAIFLASVDFENSSFEQVRFADVKFFGSAHFSNCNFIKSRFNRADFRWRANFANSRFHEQVWFYDCGFYHSSNFSDCSFLNGVDFRGSIFQRHDSNQVVNPRTGATSLRYQIDQSLCSEGIPRGAQYGSIEEIVNRVKLVKPLVEDSASTRFV